MEGDIRDVPAEEAWDHIFGYTILLDISLRGDQDRSNRKSYDTFTVIGPCVTTADEIDDPQDLQMEPETNGERRQYENTGDMVYTCRHRSVRLLGSDTGDWRRHHHRDARRRQRASDGDTIDAEIESVGSMTVDVTERDVSYAEADVQKGGQE